MGLCQRQLVDSVVEDWWLFPWNLLLFWMRKITKQRGSEASSYSDGYFARTVRVLWLKYISPYVRACLYIGEFPLNVNCRKRWGLMIRKSQATRDHKPGKQINSDILITYYNEARTPNKYIKFPWNLANEMFVIWSNVTYGGGIEIWLSLWLTWSSFGPWTILTYSVLILKLH